MADWNDELSDLVRTRHRALIGYAYLLCGSAREAEDLVQDALVKVYSPRKGPEISTAEAYVRRAILTIYLDVYRRRRRWSGIKHLVGVADRMDSHDTVITTQVDVAVALDALTPRQRACVVARYFEDLTVAQIAQSLGCAEGTVKRHLFDAHAVLAGRLGPLGDLVEDPREATTGLADPMAGTSPPQPPGDRTEPSPPEKFRPPHPSNPSAATANPRNS